MRSRLVVHEAYAELFKKTIDEAVVAGILKGKIIEGVAVETLLGDMAYPDGDERESAGGRHRRAGP